MLKRYPAIYVILISMGFSVLAATYIFLIRGRTTRDVPHFPTPCLSELVVPYQCQNLAGQLSYCLKDKCNGRWKPPRTHHCSVCGVCRMEFDHHCPWVRDNPPFSCAYFFYSVLEVGNCVTTRHMREFLLLLYSTSLVVLIGVTPVLSCQWKHASLAIQTSYGDPWAQKNWWDWYGSWIFVGGPVGRYFIGTMFGFNLLAKSLPPQTFSLGRAIIEPRLSVAILISVAFFLGFFTLVSVSDILFKRS